MKTLLIIIGSILILPVLAILGVSAVCISVPYFIYKIFDLYYIFRENRINIARKAINKKSPKDIFRDKVFEVFTGNDKKE